MHSMVYLGRYLGRKGFWGGYEETINHYKYKDFKIFFLIEFMLFIFAKSNLVFN